jgi:hypothetical protein
VGFHFEHPSGLFVLTPAGAVSRHFPGIIFPSDELENALSLAGENKLGRLASRLLLYCLHDSPRAGSHASQLLLLVRTTALVSLGAMALAMARLFQWLP